MKHEFHVIPGAAVSAILDQQPRKSIANVEAAYLAHHAGQTVNPDSYFLRFPKQPANRIIALPASIEGEQGVSGIKWIASFPGNIKQGLARASASLILNDQDTGYPFALLEASRISAVRTAASAVLAARWMNRGHRAGSRISFIGAGIIAKNILDMFVADGWEFGRISVHDPDPRSAGALRDYAAKASGMPASVESDLERALQAQIVVFATNVPAPYVLPPVRFEAGQIILNISLRDIAPELLVDAENIVDDVDHCMKANTSPHLLEQKVGNRDFITGTLAQLIRAEVTLDHARPLIFSPFGLGVLDLALGKYVYEEARERGLAVEIPDFLNDTARW